MNAPILHHLDALRAWLDAHRKAQRRPEAPWLAWQRATWSIDPVHVPPLRSCRWSWRAAGTLQVCAAKAEPEVVCLVYLTHRDTFAPRATLADARLALNDVRMVLQKCRRLERAAGFTLHEVTGHVRSGIHPEAV